MNAEIGIIGGSGFYSLLEGARSINIITKYGKPSGRVSIGRISGKSIAFIPRHGERHTLPPHKVPYKANIEALNSLGVKRIIATNAVGSLNSNFKVGQIVALDQFINLTHGRDDTFFHSRAVHVSTADPYCTQMRNISKKVAKKMKIDYRNEGSVVVINGPRFSTKAESLFFSKQGFDLINMTQYPEAALAKERCLCYLALAIVTDYDAGLLGRNGIKPVSYEDVAVTFGKNIKIVKKLVSGIVEDVPEKRTCGCSNALKGAEIKV